MNTKVVVWQ